MKTRAVISTILLILSFQFDIADAEIPLCGYQNFLFFANGMNNPQRSAKNNLEKLKEHFVVRIKSEKDIKWNPNNADLAYNYDDALPKELLEVFQQKGYEAFEEFWRYLFYPNTAPKWFQDIIIKFQKIYRKFMISEKNLQVQLKNYRYRLSNGFKILTVAHSQGNLFSNKDIDKDDPGFCLLQCQSARVDMDTYICPSDCEYLCKCELKN